MTFIVHEEVQQWCRRKDESIFNGTVICPDTEMACALSTPETIDLNNDPVPPPRMLINSVQYSVMLHNLTVCHETCLTCETPQDGATCTSCVGDKKLNGEAPTSCVNEICTKQNTYQSSAGVCMGK